MTNLAQSFASLVKTNNGMFKSPTQARFLLSQCQAHEYISSGSIMGSGFTVHYECDNIGVKAVIKYTKSKGFVTQWTRVVEGEVSVQDAKMIKSLNKSIKAMTKAIASRQASYDSGEYAKGFATTEAAEYIFTESQKSANIQLANLVADLNSFTK